MKLTPEEKQKIEKLAEIQGITQKEAVMNAVNEGLVSYKITPRKNSMLDKMQHLVGKADGPEDLSTNSAYLEDFGQ